ncbi:MAG: hypothetical protein JXQ99_05570 [Hyphomicrobiaceae bacterium]
MLYHWHELDPKSASVAGSDRSAQLYRHQIAMAFDSAASIARARGGSMPIHSLPAAVIAANDRDPDANAQRLRSAGVGVADYQIRLLARPSITSQVWRSSARYGMLVAGLPSYIIGLFRFVTPRPAQSLESCSHTIVSNDKDDRARVYNGA